jgi:hypothetical protein
MGGQGLPSDRFGGLAPFQFHHAPSVDDTLMDNDDPQYQGDPFTGYYVSHQIYMPKPK